LSGSGPANLPLNFFHYRDKPGRITKKPKPVDANGLRLFCASFTGLIAGGILVYFLKLIAG